MTTPSLNREPLYRQIYQVLENQILNNELKRGDNMPAEQTLADELQVHRSSVREALRLLEENGLVERRPGAKKLTVSAPDRRKLGSRISKTLILEDVTFFELYEGISILDTDIAALAAERISDSCLTKIAANIAATEANMNDEAALAELDIEFHQLIADATDNRVLQLSRLGMTELFYPAIHKLIGKPKVNTRMLDAHRQIFDALKNHDPEQAAVWARKHTEDFKRGYEVAGLDLHAPLGRP